MRILYFEKCTPIHFDHHYASQIEFGKPLVDSTFTLALVTGQSVTDVSQNVSANLGWDEVGLPNPDFEGDTIYSRSEVLEKRESRSRPDVGIVQEDNGLQSGRDDGHTLRPHHHGLQKRPGPESSSAHPRKASPQYKQARGTKR
jgi:acyl dehydratase